MGFSKMRRWGGRAHGTQNSWLGIPQDTVRREQVGFLIKATLGVVLWALVMIFGSQLVFDASPNSATPPPVAQANQPQCPPEDEQVREDLQIRVEELRQALTKTEEEVAEARVVRERKEDELLTVQQNLETLTTERDRLTRDLDAQNKALKVERDERRLAEAKLKKMERRVEKLDQKMEQLEQANDRLKPENEDLHRQLASWDMRNKRLKRQLKELEGQCRQIVSAPICESAAETVRSYLEKVNARLVDEAMSYWVKDKQSPSLRKTISTAGKYSDIYASTRSCDQASGMAVVFASFEGYLDGKTTKYSMDWQMVFRKQNWRILTQELSPSE